MQRVPEKEMQNLHYNFLTQNTHIFRWNADRYMAQNCLNFVQVVVGAPLPPIKKYLSVRQNVQQIVTKNGKSNFVSSLHR